MLGAESVNHFFVSATPRPSQHIMSVIEATIAHLTRARIRTAGTAQIASPIFPAVPELFTAIAAVLLPPLRHSAAASSRMIVPSGVDYRSSGERKPDIVWVIAPRATAGTMTRAKGEPSPATNAAPIGFPSAPKVSLSTPISALVRCVP
jgi:hypothetical protein